MVIASRITKYKNIAIGLIKLVQIMSRTFSEKAPGLSSNTREIQKGKRMKKIRLIQKNGIFAVSTDLYNIYPIHEFKANTKKHSTIK